MVVVSVRILGSSLERTSFLSAMISFVCVATLNGRVEICSVSEVILNVDVTGAVEYSGQQLDALHLEKTMAEEYGTAKCGDKKKWYQ